MESLYIHIPFCVRKCSYCDFYSQEYRDEPVSRYISALEKEIVLYEHYLQDLKTVYIGGGTPSALSEEHLEQLLTVVTKHSQWVPQRSSGGKGSKNEQYECTLEVNPATITPEKIDIVKAYGINRVSLGVQSFSDTVLATLGRLHTADEAKEALRLLIKRFDSVSLDIIYAIPGQDEREWEATLTTACSYQPHHVSAYELTPERHTPLWAGIEKGRLAMPDEETILRMYRTGSETMRGRGYRHYEISNYAQPGYESIHNMNYWRRGEYIGLGPSAHSFVDSKRFRNVADISRYCELLEHGQAPVEETTLITPADAVTEMIFLGLRTVEGIRLEEVRKCTAASMRKTPDQDELRAKLGSFLDRGFIVIDDDSVRLTEQGFTVSNALIVEIMELFKGNN